MKYSSALQRLWDILKRADEIARYEKNNTIHEGHRIDPEDITIYAWGAILKASGFHYEEKSALFKFYRLIDEAIEEAKQVKDIGDRDRRKLDTLPDFFLDEKILKMEWNLFKSHLEDNDIWRFIRLFAILYEKEFPVFPFLEKDLLEKIKNSFQKNLDEVIASNLSKDLQDFLVDKLENLLKAIRRYQIDGSEGLKKVAQNIISDLTLIGSSIKSEDRENPILQKFVSRVSIFSRILGISSVASIIGFTADIDSILAKYTRYLEHPEAIVVIEGELSVSESIKESVMQFEEYGQPIIEGKEEPKALPPGSDNSE
jgi:hypothetical protein